MSTLLLSISAILILILVVVITLMVVAYRDYQLCESYPSPWCWDDWQCADGSKPADKLKAIYAGCAPQADGPPSTCPCQWNWYTPDSGVNFCTT